MASVKNKHGKSVPVVGKVARKKDHIYYVDKNGNVIERPRAHVKKGGHNTKAKGKPHRSFCSKAKIEMARKLGLIEKKLAKVSKAAKKAAKAPAKKAAKKGGMTHAQRVAAGKKGARVAAANKAKRSAAAKKAAKTRAKKGK